MVIASPNICKVISFKKDLANNFNITDLGEIQYILGNQVMCDCSNRMIHLNQTAYIDSILECFNMSNCMPVSIPMTPNHNLSLPQDASWANDVDD